MATNADPAKAEALAQAKTQEANCVSKLQSLEAIGETAPPHRVTWLEEVRARIVSLGGKPSDYQPKPAKK